MTDKSEYWNAMLKTYTRDCEEHTDTRQPPPVNCHRSHGPSQKRRFPFMGYSKKLVYLPVPCPEGFNGAGQCDKSCSNAHSNLEILFHPNVYKTSECSSGMQCLVKKNIYCPYFHPERFDERNATEFKVGDDMDDCQVQFYNSFRVFENKEDEELFDSGNDLSLSRSFSDHFDVEESFFDQMIEAKNLLLKQLEDQRVVHEGEILQIGNMRVGHFRWKDKIHQNVYAGKLYIFSFSGKPPREVDAAFKLYQRPDESKKKEMEREMRILTDRNLNRKYVVDFLDYHYDNNSHTHFLITRLFSSNLTEVFKKGSFLKSKTQKLTWIQHILSATAHIHSLHIVHRDIKPQNIVLDDPPLSSDGIPTARFVDFGAGKYTDKETSSLETGWGVGTDGWRAPEQILKWKADDSSLVSNDFYFKVDVFTTMLVCYFIYSDGKALFDEGDNRRYGTKEKDLDFSDLEANLDIFAIDFFRKGLNRSPDKRLSAAELLVHPIFRQESADYTQIVLQRVVHFVFDRSLNSNILNNFVRRKYENWPNCFRAAELSHSSKVNAVSPEAAALFEYMLWEGKKNMAQWKQLDQHFTFARVLLNTYKHISEYDQKKPGKLGFLVSKEDQKDNNVSEDPRNLFHKWIHRFQPACMLAIYLFDLEKVHTVTTQDAEVCLFCGGRK
jgi:serine/threonine protein kinase